MGPCQHSHSKQEWKVAPIKAGGPASGALGWRGRFMMLGAFFVLAFPGHAYSAGPPALASSGFPPFPWPDPGPLVTCNQKYALCATAQCFTLNGVAYCKCDVLNGRSISLAFKFGDPEQDVCTLLDDGLNNGYTVSTFSLPEQVTKRYAAKYPVFQGPPPQALYTCPGGSSTGPYAQCDGGICFDSTTGASFPGVGPVAADQIVCSCPITEPTAQSSLGYQIAGPWAKDDGKGDACGPNGDPGECCSASWFDQFCFANYQPKIPTGSTIPVGAPEGTPLILSILLHDVAAINRCELH
jgi:hypothetical protein